MDWLDFKKNQQDKYNNLPIVWAFSDSQLIEGLAEKFGLTLQTAQGQIIELGGGGFMLKKEKHLLLEFYESDRNLTKEFLSNDDNLEDAIRYTMGDLEYIINRDKLLIFAYLGLNFTDERNNKIFDKAQEKYIQWYVDNDLI